MLFSDWQAVDAGVAADAGIQVDRHAPGVPLALLPAALGLRVLEEALAALAAASGPARGSWRSRASSGMSSRSATRTSSRPSILKWCCVWASRWRPARLDDLEPRAEPGRVRGPERIDVDADPVADPAGAAAAVAQEDRDRRLGLARLDPRRHLHRLAADSVSSITSSSGDPQPLGQGLADEGGVVPGQPVHRPGQLLEPAVVGEPAVPDRRVGAEDELEPLGAAAGAGGPGRPGVLGATSLALRAVPAITPLRRALPPGRLEVARQRLPPPVVADDLQARAVGLAQEDAPAPRWPTCRRRAARSGAAGSSPCRRRRGRRPTTRARGPRGRASGRARPSRPGGARGGSGAGPCSQRSSSANFRSAGAS